jgi:hypothetical protein
MRSAFTLLAEFAKITGAAFPKIKPNKPAGPDATARKAAADMRKTSAATAAAARPTHFSEPIDQARPPPKK